MKIAVFGAGAWGTAMACHAAATHEVLLWARDASQAQALHAQRRNLRYLAEATLPASLVITADHAQASAHAAQGLAIVATPMSALREQLTRIAPSTPLLWLCKGFESGTGWLGHEIAQSLRPGEAWGALSGPSFAAEVAQSRPTALVVASADARLCALAQSALHDDRLRVYTSGDLTGVEVGGAMKNVLAIAAGILDGLAQAAGACGTPQPPGVAAPGLNARAALITRGLAEMTRLGVALGAQAQTFMGLSGLGDLVLTCTGALSRNRQVGLRLARGESLAQALAGLGHVAEGVSTADTALARARGMGVDLPITEAVSAVLQARLSPAEAVARLMAREARAEDGL